GLWWESGGSEDALDDPVEQRVQGAEVGGGDGDEDHGHRGGLDQGLAVGPLHPLELRPAGDDEAHDRAALSLRGLGRDLAALRRLLGATLALALLAAALAAADLGRGRLLRRGS